MHMTIIYLMRGVELDDISEGFVESDFFDRFCSGCGSHHPRYFELCDWFKFANDSMYAPILKAKRGLPEKEGKFAIVEIKDLLDNINELYIYGIASRSKFYSVDSDCSKFEDLLNKINSKTIKGCVAILNCHF